MILEIGIIFGLIFTHMVAAWIGYEYGMKRVERALHVVTGKSAERFRKNTGLE